MFTIEMLAAEHGDALWIEYGQDEPAHRILIDGGPLAAFPALKKRALALPDGDKRLALLVISHVDTDHIEGIIGLLAKPRGQWLVAPDDIWFNGFRHLRPQDTLGASEGEFISALIHDRAPKTWNRAFGGHAVVLGDADAIPPSRTLDGGMVLTLLSPDRASLDRLADKWARDLSKWKMTPGDLQAALAKLSEKPKFGVANADNLGPDDLTADLLRRLSGDDPAAANASSIAFLASFEGKSCLFLADAHMDVICASLRKLLPPGQAFLRVDAVKMSHHGSRNNVTQEFLNLIDAQHYLFSSNGARHGHPNDEAVQAVIVGSRRKPTLWFNYCSPFTLRYLKPSLESGANYAVRYPAPGQSGIVIQL